MAVLVVEVTERAPELADLLRAGGVAATATGSAVEMPLDGDATYDAVLAGVNSLSVGLVRLQRPRHRMAELFKGPAGGSA